MFSYAQIARAVHGRQGPGAGGAPRRIVHDSRDVEEGDLFVALKGEHTDGHLYLSDVFAKGASGAIVSNRKAIPPGSENVIVVADTRQALWDLAGAWRGRLEAVFVGITGTCGKTTTKELLAHLVAGEREVFAAQGNYNTDVGLPLSLLAMPTTAQVGIFEVGAGKPGEIGPLARLLSPDLAVVTLVGRGHLAGFGDVATVAREKWDLVRALPASGTAIVNADCPELADLASGWKGRLITFGLDAGALRGRVVQVSPSLVVETTTPALHLESSLLGRHNATNLLAAAGTALALGVSPFSVEARSATFRGPPHRLRPVWAPFGLVLDDTYNSNPESMTAALETLAELDWGGVTRAFVFGDMFELGPDAERCHDEILDLALRLGIGPIFPVGDLAAAAARRATPADAPGTFVMSQREDLVLRVREALSGRRSVLLVKGSHLLGLGKVVEALTRLEP